MRTKEYISQVHGQTCPFDQISMGQVNTWSCQELLALCLPWSSYVEGGSSLPPMLNHSPPHSTAWHYLSYRLCWRSQMRKTTTLVMQIKTWSGTAVNSLLCTQGMWNIALSFLLIDRDNRHRVLIYWQMGAVPARYPILQSPVTQSSILIHCLNHHLLRAGPGTLSLTLYRCKPAHVLTVFVFSVNKAITLF